MIRRLWTTVQSPVFMRSANGCLTVFWAVMIPVSFITGLARSVPYVSALSLWALVASHWAGWQSGRVEVRQEEQTTNAP